MTACDDADVLLQLCMFAIVWLACWDWRLHFSVSSLHFSIWWNVSQMLTCFSPKRFSLGGCMHADFWQLLNCQFSGICQFM